MNRAAVRGKRQSAQTVSCSAPQGSHVPGRPKQQIIDTHLREHIAPELRSRMVAEAAYFFSEHRGFAPGDELADWLAAEDQIDAALRLPDLQAAALMRAQSR